ncbi:polysaccharide biosynthesis/export family protein [Flavobacterium urocaniciphilum]|uniref:Protein involved in gliding motility EpsA n=1 Tax=Flavobacterium urocaniciphilum TaxID=1299341 RepID=A0A1H8YRD9_9FLAO|nr:polysaccharide biosynthesis/export family protein [Flavobacterium urocaniciphilum]SEP54740.1 protein involved in gliding motility EpsA [Flavobacterium urocaniciphilum]
MKFFKHILYIITVSLQLTSCISHKDTLYLEKNKDKVADIEINADAYKPYRLQVDDILSIDIRSNNAKDVEIFSKKKDVSGNNIINQDQLYFDGYQVDGFGNIRIPVLGSVNVQGQTVEEVSKLLEKKLLEEYFTPNSNLFVIVKLAGIRYTINGEVGSTGTKTVFQDKLNVLEAIANSGDINLTGNKKEVVVMRKIPTGYQSETLDLTDANVINSQFFYLKPHDYIYVKPLKQKTTGFGLNGIQTVTTVLSVFGVLTTTYLLIKSL